VSVSYTDTPNPKVQGRVDVAYLSVGQVLEKQLGFNCRGVTVDNLTNQWLFIAEAFAYCPPYVSGRQIPLQGTQKVSVKYATPIGFTQQQSIAGQQAILRFTENLVSPVPGIPVAPAAVRWTINLSPAAGTVGSVTKAGVIGVIHTADILTWTIANFSATTTSMNTADATDSTVGTIQTFRASITVTAGDLHVISVGPLVGLKGLASNNAMTIEWQAGPGVAITGAYYGANMVGYDQ
jgi:hypothetical protein